MARRYNRIPDKSAAAQNPPCPAQRIQRAAEAARGPLIEAGQRMAEQWGQHDR